MTTSLTWTCRCGQVQASLKAGSGTRFVCYCASCQAFNRHLGAMDSLDPAGGSDLYQTAPASVGMTRGAEHLRVLQLTEKGPYRWFAGCCKTPLANTLSTRAVPFLSLTVPGLDQPEALGPVRVRVNRKDATAHIDGASGSLAGMMVPLFARILGAYLNGGWKKAPFFTADGTPRATPDPLDAAARARAYGQEPAT